jgi:hypothetical protein
MGAYEHSTIAMHPADTNQDYTITQSEFNAYNQAWRNNTDWQTTQNTIAADFLTRAGYILQKGGRILFCTCVITEIDRSAEKNCVKN